MGCNKVKVIRKLRIRNQTVRAFLAEFLGTFVLVCFGDGSVAQYVFGQKTLITGFLAVNITWGIGVMMGVYVSAGVSGGHINPAVTLVMAMLCKLEWWKVPIYFAAQYLGAFAGAACVYGVYYEALQNFDGGVRQISGANGTAGIFATYPKYYLSTSAGLGDQILGTALLLICVLAITDAKNDGAPKGVVAISVGLCVVGIGAAFGLNCGYAINPARDLGPRIFATLAGWGNKCFTAYNNWSWVPIVGPHLGAILGALVYQLLVGLHTANDEDDDYIDEKNNYKLGGINNDMENEIEPCVGGSYM